MSDFLGDSPKMSRLCLVTAIILAIGLISVVVADSVRSIPYPLAHDYGEGILGWMTMEISHGRMPYGDISSVPSRYACYGPLPALMAAGLSPVLSYFTGDIPFRFIMAGRILNTLYWLLAGAILGALCRPRLAPFFFAPVLALVISHTSFMWSFRADSMLIMLEASILYVLVRHTAKLNICLPILVSLLALVKPTGALDLPAIGLMALALHASKPFDYIRTVWKPVLVSIIAAPAVFFAIDFLIFGGWMSNNTLTVQRISGWAEPYSPDFMVGTFFLSSTTWALLLWSLWGPAAQQDSKARLGFVALAMGYLLTGALALKYGAVTNYYFPLLVLMAGCASMILRTNAQMMVFLGAIAMTSFPLAKLGGEFRSVSNEDLVKIEELGSKVVAAHNSDRTITEDVFYSVMAGKQTMITDIFQYNLVAAGKGIDNSKLLGASKMVWGDFRMQNLFGKQDLEAIKFKGDFKPESLPVFPYLRAKSFPVSELDQSEWGIVPFTPNHGMPWFGYVRNTLIPSVLLLLAAMFWDTRRSGYLNQ